jgi:hypothetical protein
VQLVQGHLDVKGVLRGIVGEWLTSNRLLLDVLSFGLDSRDNAFHFCHNRACGAGRKVRGV